MRTFQTSKVGGRGRQGRHARLRFNDPKNPRNGRLCKQKIKAIKNTFFSNFPIFCRSHMQVHIPLEERKPLKKHFLCSYCGRSFSNSSNLTVHIRRYSSKCFTLPNTNPNQMLILFFLTDIPENDHSPVIFATPVSQDHLTYNVMCARTPERKSVILNLRHFIESFYSIVFIPILTGVCNVCGKGMYY